MDNYRHWCARSIRVHSCVCVHAMPRNEQDLRPYYLLWWRCKWPLFRYECFASRQAEQTWCVWHENQVNATMKRGLIHFVTVSFFNFRCNDASSSSAHSSYHLLKLKLNVSRFIIYVIIHFNYVMLFLCVRTTVCFSEQLKALRALRANVQSGNGNDDEESVWQFVECIKENS